MLTDEAWIRGEIECCDAYPCEHGRLMKSALLELLAARRVVEAARASLANAALVCDEDCALADALKHYDEVTR